MNETGSILRFLYAMTSTQHISYDFHEAKQFIYEMTSIRNDFHEAIHYPSYSVNENKTKGLPWLRFLYAIRQKGFPDLEHSPFYTKFCQPELNDAMSFYTQFFYTQFFRQVFTNGSRVSLIFRQGFQTSSTHEIFRKATQTTKTLSRCNSDIQLFLSIRNYRTPSRALTRSFEMLFRQPELHNVSALYTQWKVMIMTKTRKPKWKVMIIRLGNSQSVQWLLLVIYAMTCHWEQCLIVLYETIRNDFHEIPSS